MPLFDTHCHLQDKSLLDRLPDVLERAAGAGVENMACCGTGPKDWLVVRDLCATHPRVMPFFGLHPLYIATRSISWLEDLEGFLAAAPSGVGEIGLDFLAGGVDKREQEQIFLAQFRLARRMNRPVSIHCRRAFGALVESIEREGGAHHGCVLHSYSGSAELVPRFERLGFFISFSGAFTRPGNIRGPKALGSVSEDRLLLETDSPDIAPAGGRGEPCDLPLAAAAAAAIRGVSLEYLAETVLRNSMRAMGAGAQK